MKRMVTISKKLSTGPLLGHMLSMVDSTLNLGVGGGFFTMIHRVANVRDSLKEQLYSGFDHYTKRTFIDVYSKQVSNNIKEVMQSLGDKEQKRKANELCQAEASEVFAETFELEELSRFFPVQMSLPFPSVTFGKHTSLHLKHLPYIIEETGPFYRKNYEEQQKQETPLPPKSKISESGHLENSTALHMVLENAEPIGMVRVARTYFLTSNNQHLMKINPVTNFAGHIDDYEIEDVKDPLFVDEYKLTSCSLKMIQTYLKFIQGLKHNLRPEIISKVKSAIEKKIFTLNQKLRPSDKQSELQEELKIEIKLYDIFGAEHDFFEMNDVSDLDSRLVIVRFELSNIRSVVNPNESMGSITLSDSFLFEGDHYLNLTSEVPYFDFFECRSEYSQAIREMKEIYAQKLLGQRLAKQTGVVQVYIPFIDQLDRSVIDFPVTSTSVSWFENSLKFHSDKLGCFIIQNSQITKAEFLRSLRNPWVIFTLKENIFFPKLSQALLCLRFTEESVKEIFLGFRDHLIKEGIEVQDIEEHPAYLSDALCLHNQLEIKNNLEQEPILQTLKSVYISKPAFYLELVKAGQAIEIASQTIVNKVPPEQLESYISPVHNLKFEGFIKLEESKVDVLVIVGPLGTGKRSLLDSFNDYREHFSVPGNTVVQKITYSEENLIELGTQDFLALIKESVGNAEEQVQPGKGMILLSIPHTINHLAIIRELDNSNQFRLRSVSAKLVASEIYSPNMSPVENLSQFLQQGYTQYCFVDTDGYDSNLVWSRINTLKEAYPHVTFLEMDGEPDQYKMTEVLMSRRCESPQARLLRQLNKSDYSFGYKYMFFNYRIPIREDRIKYLKTIISDFEGALLLPEEIQEQVETA